MIGCYQIVQSKEGLKRAKEVLPERILCKQYDNLDCCPQLHELEQWNRMCVFNITSRKNIHTDSHFPTRALSSAVICFALYISPLSSPARPCTPSFSSCSRLPTACSWFFFVFSSDAFPQPEHKWHFEAKLLHLAVPSVWLTNTPITC